MYRVGMGRVGYVPSLLYVELVAVIRHDGRANSLTVHFRLDHMILPGKRWQVSQREYNSY